MLLSIMTGIVFGFVAGKTILKLIEKTKTSATLSSIIIFGVSIF